MIIYDIHGNKLLDAILTESAEHEQELSKSDFVKLSWDSDVKTAIPAGSYIVPFADGLKYRLLNAYTPSETDKSFRYDISFHHPLMWLSRVPFLYVENDLKQQEWSFEGLTVTALEYVCKAINEAFNITDDTQKFTYTLCGMVDGSVSFSVSSNDILSVLSSIAQACKDNNCEWHLSWEHRCLYFGQIAINLGEEVPLLKVHDNIQTASVSESKEDYYNCFYPQGSTKNMSRKAQVGTGNVATNARLGLNSSVYPDGCIYIGTDGKVVSKTEFEASNAIKQTLALSFDDIYPHIDLYAYNIRKRTRYLKNDTTGEYELDSNGNKKVYTVWYMRLAYCTTTKDTTKTLVNTTTDKDEQGNIVIHYWYDYELDRKKQVLQGYTLKGTFKVNTHTTDNKYDVLNQSLVGQPNGQEGFELYYHEANETLPVSEPTGDSGVSVLKGDYEIVMYQSGDTIIPTNEEDGLIPHGKAKPDLTCNIVVLFNIVMGEYETKLAQEELAARTIKEINRRTKDNNNYTAHSNAVEFARKNPNLYIGQKVTYDDGFGYQLPTRVIKLITKLDYPIIQEITVGNQAIKGTISQLKEDVATIMSGNWSGGGMSYAQIETLLKNYDTKAQNKFLSKTHDDSTEHKLTMGEAAVKGNATIGDAAKSTDYTHTGFPFGKGWAAMKDDGSGASMLEVDKLFVRMKAYFAELEIRKISYLGGNYVFSSAGGTIYYVEWLDANDKVLEKTKDNESLVYTFRCYLYSDDGTTKTMNWFQTDDQVRCQNFGDKTKTRKAANGVITAEDYTTHYWWRRVNAVDSGVIAAKGDEKKYEYVDFLNKPGEYGADSDFPEEGDVMVQFGNWTEPERQGVIMIVVTGDDAPAIIEWQNVGANNNHFTIPDDEYTRISPRGDGNIFRGKFISVSGTTTDLTGKSIDEQIKALIDQLNDIKNQADKKFDIWFNGGEPHPNSAEDKITNAPASDWTTDAEKGLHAQDLYYDTDKAPGSNGGRAWRWMAHNTNGTVYYYWDKVTDADTISALDMARDVQNQVNDIADDGIISHGSEKSQLLIEWNKTLANYQKYSALAATYALKDQAEWDIYYANFFKLAVMLNGGQPYTDDNVKSGTTPSWLDADLRKDTAVNASTYRSTWKAYNDAFAALLKSLSDKTKGLVDAAQTSADEKVQTFVSKSTESPTPPYKKGDFWIQTDKKNNVLICVTGKDSGSYSSEDWTDLSDLVSSTDVRTILATLADKVYALVWDDYLGKSTIRYVNVYIGSQPSSLVYDYDLSYYNGVLYKRNSSWQEVNGSGFESTFATVMSILGTITIRVSNYTNTASPKQYDLALTQISIKDPVDGNKTMGTCEIEMYNENRAWEVLRTCTLAIIKNYGDHIVSLVGNLDGRIKSLSGTYVTKDVFNAFSDKFTYDDEGNIINTKKSGLLTTADGNLLYAMSQSNTVNMLMGTTTGVGWTKEATSDESYFSFNEANREFRLVNYYPAFLSGYSGASYSTLKSPIVRVERGKKYIISFQAIQGSGVGFHVGVRFGTASLCDHGELYFSFDGRITSSNYMDSDKQINTIYQSRTDSSRYYVIIEANSSYDYMQVLFINAIYDYETSNNSSDSSLTYVSGSWPYGAKQDTLISTDAPVISHNYTMKKTVQHYARYTGSDTQYATFTRTTVEQVTSRSAWASKLQLEKAVRTALADIEPSPYKESQNAIESYIKQTADIITLYADNITINADHKLSINGDYFVVNTTNFKLNEKGALSLTGMVTATSGSIGGWKIDGDNLCSGNSGAAINIDQDGYDFAHFGNTGDNAFLSVRMDNKASKSGHWIYAARFSTYGGAGTALSLLANSTGYALESFGSANILSRNGESTMINHLALKLAKNSASFDDGDKQLNFGHGGITIKEESFSPSIIITNRSYTNITLPANPQKGDIRIVVQGSSDKVIITDPDGHWFQHGDETSRRSVNSDTNGQWTFFLYDGFYWQVVYCNGRPW